MYRPFCCDLLHRERGKWFFFSAVWHVPIPTQRPPHDESSCFTMDTSLFTIIGSYSFCCLGCSALLCGGAQSSCGKAFRGGGWFALKVHVYKSSKLYLLRHKLLFGKFGFILIHSMQSVSLTPCSQSQSPIKDPTSRVALCFILLKVLRNEEMWN